MCAEEVKFNWGRVTVWHQYLYKNARSRGISRALLRALPRGWRPSSTRARAFYREVAWSAFWVVQNQNKTMWDQFVCPFKLNLKFDLKLAIEYLADYWIPLDQTQNRKTDYGGEFFQCQSERNCIFSWGNKYARFCFSLHYFLVIAYTYLLVMVYKQRFLTRN